MSYYADDIRRIAKQQENKPGIGSADSRQPVIGGTVPMIEITDDPGGGMVSPITRTILTYDDTLDVTIEDINAVQHVIKTGKTGKDVDANGKEILFDIVFTPPA